MALNSGWTYREQVGAGSGLTVLEFLTVTRRHSTRAEWSQRLEGGEVEIDGRRASSTSILAAGQTIAWHRPPWHEDDVPFNYRVVFEDEAVVAVDKPAGLPTLPAGGFVNHTLLALLRARYPGASPLHRLGRHTSGLVLFARTPTAASALSRAWRGRAVKKTYRALCVGTAGTETLEIEAPIGPVPHPRLGTVEAASESGKPSRSVAAVLQSGGDRTLFSVDLITGRPHQIRIHLAFAGHPLVGDPLYETGGGLKANPGLPGDGGYLLHAEHLQFVHPVSSTSMQLHAPAPPALQSLSQQATASALAQ